MKTKRNSLRLLNFIIVLLLILPLSGCVPSLKYQIMENFGYYPNQYEFPNTKWECREIDMHFCVLDYGENTLIGEYCNDGKTYRVVGSFWFGTLDFGFYDSSSEDKTKASRPFDSEKTVAAVYMDYIYKDGVIQCTVGGWQNFDSEVKTLTFEMAGEIGQEPEYRWRCDELDIYMDSFSDIDSYFKGKAVINGKTCGIQAFKITNDGYYRFTVKNEDLEDNLRGTSNLVNMYLDVQEDVIIAKVADDYLSDPQKYEYWNCDITTLTFKREEIKGAA